MKKVFFIIVLTIIIKNMILAQGQWTTYPQYSGHYVVNVDKKNNKWFGAYGNTFSILKLSDTGWTTYNTSNTGLSASFGSVRVIKADTGNSVWFGVSVFPTISSDGVVKYDGQNWTLYNNSNTGLSSFSGIWSIAIDNQNNKWFGRMYGGLVFYDNTNWSVYTQAFMGMPTYPVISSIAIDNQNNKWLGLGGDMGNCCSGGGIYVFDGVNSIHYNSGNSGLPNNNVTSIVIDNQQNKWFGTDSGLVKFDGTTWVTYKASNSGIPNNSVRCVALDSTGNLWISYKNFGGGLTKFDGQNWQIFNTVNSSIPGDNVFGIAVDTNNAIWVTTNGGIGKLSTNHNNCITWQNTPPTDTLTLNANNYLCNQSIIQSTQNQSENINSIKRQDLAKIVYLGLLGNNAVTPADSFTSLFYDLQNPNVPYYKYAKALSFLEYGDGISPFSRVFSHFRPGDSILRKDAMKVFAEAWNLPLNSTGPSPFTDVATTDPMYPWIKTMHSLGMVQGTGGGAFSPNAYLTRNDAFIILYRMLLQLTKPIPQNSDYYRPFNITPQNSNRIAALDEGNFSNYTKTSFAVDGLMPLVFEHSYNSSSGENPEEYYRHSTMLSGNVYNQHILSQGWSHNYNIYIVPIFGDTASINTDDRILVHWGNGATELYKLPASTGLRYLPEASGNYNDLVLVYGQYVLTTKNQIKYYFQIVPGNTFIAPLHKIKDRNNNETNLSYSLNNNITRLDTVTDPSGRTLTFSYGNNNFPYQITSVTATTGSITRNISFGYNTAGQLTSYTDPKNQTTTYNYATTGINKGLLTSITLPKGNTITNTYQNRRLQNSNMNNGLSIAVNSVNNYSNGAATTNSTTSITRNGQTLTYTQARNTLANVTAFSGPGVNITSQYNDAANPTLLHN